GRAAGFARRRQRAPKLAELPGASDERRFRATLHPLSIPPSDAAMESSVSTARRGISSHRPEDKALRPMLRAAAAGHDGDLTSTGRPENDHDRAADAHGKNEDSHGAGRRRVAPARPRVGPRRRAADPVPARLVAEPSVLGQAVREP